MDPLDQILAVLLLFRFTIGGVMIAHGYNHIFGSGGIDGTASWFDSIGMRPPRVCAWLASLTELAAGASLVLGLFTPLGCAGVIGVMAVAWIAAHRNNGFFIFRPGQGWEYVAVLLMSGVLISALGPGSWSLDARIGDDWPFGTSGLWVALIGGFGGAAVVLATCWRPPKPTVKN